MKDCKLIGTLPRLQDKKSIDEMMNCPYIGAVRLNTGVNELLTPEEIIDTIKTIEEMYKKTVWIDLKGRQLRVNAWADPSYEAVELNHEIEIEYPAEIMFRGSNKSNIIHTRGNKIVLDSPPDRAVGKGQSVNIKARSLVIKGFLTPLDIELLQASREIGMNNYMASFVEEVSDLVDIYRLNNKANIICKIESEKGMNFINNTNLNLNLMAARDDLYIETSRNIKMLKCLKNIITKDPNAICASRLFSSLNSDNYVSLSDYEDLELMYLYGYRNYMLGDDIKGPKLVKAMEAWREFINE
jgi:pyruvate kinase